MHAFLSKFYWSQVSLVAVLAVSGPPVLAQGQDGNQNQNDVLGQNVGTEFGFFAGNLLPDQIGGVTEITGLGGLRAGLRMGPTAFAESTFMTGNGNGVEWKNISVSARLDIPVETLVGFAFLGPDVTYYKGANSSSNRVIFGGHVGGGIQVLLGGISWFRGDMKLGFSPGTTLFIGFGFAVRLPGGGAP